MNQICLFKHMIPFELYPGNKISVRHLKPFCITAYVGVSKQLRNKLQPKEIFIGYSLRTKGFRICLSQEENFRCN